MKKIYFFVYFMVVSIPLLLGLVVWQSTRYQSLHRDTLHLDQVQAEWVEGNNRLIAEIAEYSSPQRIDHIAKSQLSVQKLRPEHLLQIRITGGMGHGH